MKSAILISGVINFIVKTIIVRIHREKFQKIDMEMNEYIINANEEELTVLQKYVNKCWIFQGYMTCSYYLISIGVITGPLFLPQKFPCDAVYPFPIDSIIISTIVYLHQSIVGFQCSAGMALDCQAALFLWYISARLEILAKQTKNIDNFKNLRSFIKIHQNILSSADEVIYAIRFIFLTTIFMTKIGMIFGAIILLSNQPMLVKLQFTVLVISASMSIFVCIWPAEKLINVSGNFMTRNIFHVSSTHSPAMRKLWLSVIRRTQTPITIKVVGFMDALSYEFFSSFLSTVFSYFTALRVAVQA
ncbi:hypothetical protein PV328_009634 [Microctonus aethiopoides]|uniref:Uncharacterized protein n=1 Tax=Microctonus aethiopoides TaxID=144406 RepID=A0AA39C6E3_9HYME|nr:hypothetical protein PV328_009634 [Microctonus aethiopoides]